MSAVIAAYKKCARWPFKKDTPSVISLSAITLIKVAPDGAEIHVAGEKSPFRLTSAPDPFRSENSDLMDKFVFAGIKPVAIYAMDGHPASYVIPGAVNYVHAPNDESIHPTIHMQNGMSLPVQSSRINFILDTFQKAGVELVKTDLLNGNAQAFFMPSNVASLTTPAYASLGDRLRTEWKCAWSWPSSKVDRNEFTTVYAPRLEILFTDHSKIEAKAPPKGERLATLYKSLVSNAAQLTA